MSAPEPGWYLDPGDPDLYRWWDGSTWTTFTAPVFDDDQGDAAEVGAVDPQDVAPDPAPVAAVAWALDPDPGLQPARAGQPPSQAVLDDPLDVLALVGPAEAGAPAAYPSAQPEPGWDDSEEIFPAPARRWSVPGWRGLPRGMRRAAAGVAAVAVVLAGAGAAWAVMSGRGPQPESALPADTAAFVKIDLDPPADQKINLVRFVTNLPEQARPQGVEGSDPLGSWVDSSLLGGQDFTWADIDAWAGSRAAVAVLPPAASGGDPEVVVVVAVEDETAMAAFLAEHGTGVAAAMVRDGYAVLAPDQAVVDRVVAAAPLADSAGYQRDAQALGGGQVAVAWADLAAVSALTDQQDLAGLGAPAVLDALTSPGSRPQVSGHVMAGLRVEPDAVDLSVVAVEVSADGLVAPMLPETSDAGSLPASSVAVLSVGNVAALLRPVLDGVPQAASAFDSAAREAGLDRAGLLGLLDTTATLVVLPAPGGSGAPWAGVRLTPTRTVTEDSWTAAIRAIGVSSPVRVSMLDNRVWISAGEQSAPADTALSGGPALADDPLFVRAVPASGSLVGYVRLGAVWDYLDEQAEASGQPAGDLPRLLAAAGWSATTGQDGVSRGQVRLVFDTPQG